MLHNNCYIGCYSFKSSVMLRNIIHMLATVACRTFFFCPNKKALKKMIETNTGNPTVIQTFDKVQRD